MDTEKYDQIFKIYGKSYAIDWKLLKAQVKEESSFNHRACSRAGAVGLAQFMPRTWKQWGTGDILNPEDNIRAQARYMAHLLPLFENKIELALASYNWGMGNLKWLIEEMDSTDLDILITNPKFPKETKTYVERVMKSYSYYADLERRGN